MNCDCDFDCWPFAKPGCPCKACQSVPDALKGCRREMQSRWKCSKCGETHSHTQRCKPPEIGDVCYCSHQTGATG